MKEYISMCYGSLLMGKDSRIIVAILGFQVTVLFGFGILADVVGDFLISNLLLPGLGIVITLLALLDAQSSQD